MRIVHLSLLLACAGSVPAGAQTPRLLVVPIQGPIGTDHVRLVTAAVDAATGSGIAAVLLHVSGGGGRYDVAQTVADQIRAAPVPVVSLISGTATGAAVLIAIAADTLFMADVAALAAEEDPDRAPLARRVLRQLFADHAVRHGAPASLGAALLDPDDAGPGDPRLPLDGPGAVEAGLARAVVAGVAGLVARPTWDGLVVDTVDGAWIGTTIEVRNLNTRDARVYLRRGPRMRLGTVTSMNTARFEIPPEFLTTGATFQVQVELIGSSERASTEPIRSEAGLLVEWVLEEPLRQSNYFVSRRY